MPLGRGLQVEGVLRVQLSRVYQALAALALRRAMVLRAVVLWLSRLLSLSLAVCANSR